MNEPVAPTPARDPRRPFIASPFTRLARTHAFSVGGDALFTVGLAGSVFFSVPFNEARSKVVLYLLLTFAPFAVAAPMIGPVIDRLRGGRRWVIIGSLALRALLCLLIVRDISHLTFYLEAFLMLVFAKGYLISRAALVPTTVRTDQELVEANSKLSLLGGVAAVAAAIPGGILLKLGGAQWTVGLAGLVFVVGAGFALRLPKSVVAATPAGDLERAELRTAGIRLAASAMALIRAAVGFLVLLLAFAFKNGGAPLWYLAVAGGMAQVGLLVGAALAPRLRQAADESRILSGSLALTAAGGVLCAVLGGVFGAALMSFLLGVTSSTSKQAFDALVQRDAPDANRGRSFARFETRFQLAWVLGAFLPVVIPFPTALGFLLIAVVVVMALVSYQLGRRRVSQGTYEWESPSRKLIRFGLRRMDASLAGASGAPAPAPAVAPRPAPPAPVTSPVEPTSAWEPPAGFVSHPLTGDETEVASAPSSPTPGPSSAEQPGDQPGEQSSEQPSLFDEPRWREPGS
jgi:MFS family permease